MKSMLLIAVVGLSAVTFNSHAGMDPKVENTLIAVCKAGASNSLITFNGTMKEYRINKQRIFPRLVCNGENFYNFALNNDAPKTALRIAPHMKGEVTIKDITMSEQPMDVYAVNF